MNNKEAAVVDLNLLLLFKKIADFGSLSKTALDQRLPKSAVSQKLAKLEDEVGARLFHRNTRKIALTEVGETVYRYAAQISEQRDGLMDAVASTNDEPSGLIRMTAPPDIGVHLTKTVLKRLTTDHPGLRVELDLSTRFVDLINEGYDIALRASDGGFQDSNLVATKLKETEVKMFAGKAYLDSAAYKIEEPADLTRHHTIAFSPQPGMKLWDLKLIHDTQDSVTVQLVPTLIMSTFQGVLEAVKAGIGVGMLPAEICQSEVANGEILPVISDWKTGNANFYAVYPSKKYLSARVKVMLHYLASSW